MKPRHLIILSLFFVLIADSGYAQQNVLDSLRLEITKNEAGDSLKVKAIVAYAVEALNNNTSDFLPYLTEVISISKQIGYSNGLGKGYMIGQIYFSDRSDYEKAFLYADSAFAILKEDKSSRARISLGHLHNNVAGDYFKLGDSEKAMANLMASAAIFEPLDHPFLASVYSTIAEVYEKTNESDIAIEYDKKAVLIAEKGQNQRSLATRLLNFSIRRINRKEFPEAAELLKRAEPIVMKLGNTTSLWQFHYNSGQMDEGNRNYRSAVDHYKKALHYANINADVYQKTNVMEGLSSCLTMMKRMPEAKMYLDSLLFLATTHDMKQARRNAFSGLSKWYESQQMFREANIYLQKQMGLSDSLVSEESKVKIAGLEIMYNVKKKEQEISTLKSETELQVLELRQKNIFNAILIGSTLSILIIAALGYRTYSQKQKLQQQRINELETEQQLTATEGVLKGEEQERTRIAKDLHDGLGGMLSGIKYSFNSMKGNLIMTPDNQQAFERSMDMLDSSIKEMRRVAHNMMPEALVKFGLDSALNDFCNDINQSGGLKVNYLSIGLENVVLEQTMAITLYRVVQELINNTMKHASATTAIVQVTKTGETIAVTVEDDGRGFDTTILSHSKGIGWSNIMHRVDFLKGKLDVDSQYGKGTSVHIEFHV